MAHCDTPVILDISLRERQNLRSEQYFPWLQSGYWWHNCQFGLDGKLHTATAGSWMWSTQIRQTALGQLGKSALPRKKADRHRTKVMIDHKSLSEGLKRSLKYCQRPYIDIDIAFHQLWGKTVTLVGWFHSIGSISKPVKIPVDCSYESNSNWQWRKQYGKQLMQT